MRFFEIIQDASDPLLEMPQQVFPTSFDLDKPVQNQEFLTKQLPKVVEIIEQTDDYKIVKTGDGVHGWIFLHNIKDNSVDYVVQYATRNWNWMPKSVTQCIVWRNPLSIFARNITSKMFFGYLLKNNPAILSDMQQTKDGKDFWFARMADAVQRNLKVGICNTTTHSILWYDPIKNPSFIKWMTAEDTYGSGDKYLAIRYIISN